MDEIATKKDNSKWIDPAIITTFFIGLLFFLFFTGTLNSGYHFTDDHEMTEIHSDLAKTPIVETSVKWITNDFHIRFRPLYYVHRVLEIKIFGTNLLLLSLYTSLLISTLISLFYAWARTMKYSVVESLFFVLLAFVGDQSAIWWRLGPNETIGLVFLGLSFYFMAKCLDGEKYQLYSILSCIFLVFASLSKESFVIIIPAFALFKTWKESKYFGISIRESLKHNAFLFFPLVIMAAELWFIFFVVGTNQIGYAGTCSGIGQLARGIWIILTSKNMLLPWIALIAVVAALYIGSFFFSKSDKWPEFRNSLDQILPLTVFFLLILLPNLYLYAKSGMSGRYLLPTTIGVGLFVIAMLHNVRNILFYCAVLIICCSFVRDSFHHAIKIVFAFSVEGQQTNEFLSAAVRNSKADAKILLAVEPVTGSETTWATKIYLSQYGIANLYGFPLLTDYSSDMERSLKAEWEKWFKGRMISDMHGQPDLILIINKNQTSDFFCRSGIRAESYRSLIKEENPHAVLIKK